MVVDWRLGREGRWSVFWRATGHVLECVLTIHKVQIGLETFRRYESTTKRKSITVSWGQVNAAQDAIELVAQLRASHSASQQGHDDAKTLKFTGLNLTTGEVRDNLNAGVLEPAISKIKCLRFATEAAITILRIDDMIKLNPKQQGDPRRR